MYIAALLQRSYLAAPSDDSSEIVLVNDAADGKNLVISQSDFDLVYVGNNQQYPDAEAVMSCFRRKPAKEFTDFFSQLPVVQDYINTLAYPDVGSPIHDVVSSDADVGSSDADVGSSAINLEPVIEPKHKAPITQATEDLMGDAMEPMIEDTVVLTPPTETVVPISDDIIISEGEPEGDSAPSEEPSMPRLTSDEIEELLIGSASNKDSYPTLADYLNQSEGDNEDTQSEQELVDDDANMEFLEPQPDPRVEWVNKFTATLQDGQVPAPIGEQWADPCIIMFNNMLDAYEMAFGTVTPSIILDANNSNSSALKSELAELVYPELYETVVRYNIDDADGFCGLYLVAYDNALRYCAEDKESKAVQIANVFARLIYEME